MYDRKNALVAADILNDKVLSFYQEQQVDLLRILTDRGTEYYGAREHHEYQLYLSIEDINHTKTKAKSPQTNGICERLHRTMQDEFYVIAFRKKIYGSLEELQKEAFICIMIRLVRHVKNKTCFIAGGPGTFQYYFFTMRSG